MNEYELLKENLIQISLKQEVSNRRNNLEQINIKRANRITNRQLLATNEKLSPSVK